MQQADSVSLGRAASPMSARAASRVLDALFSKLSTTDGSKLLSAICRGAVTGAALAIRLGWTREKVSKLARDLQRGGLIEARREGVWVRFLPTCTGIEVLVAWMADQPPIGPSLDLPSAPIEERRRRLRSLKSATARRLFARIYSSAEVTQGNLARECGISQPVTSRTLAKLVKGGLIRACRDGREVRYTVDPEGVQQLHQWIDNARRQLVASRVVAEAQDLADQCLTAEAPGEVSTDIPAATLPRPAHDAPSSGPQSSSAEEILPPLSDPVSGDNATGGSHTTLPHAEPPSLSLRAATPSPPPQAARSIRHTLKSEDIRAGDCFIDKCGGEIKIVRLNYDEWIYLYKPPSGQVFERHMSCHPFAATLVKAVASVGF